MDNIKMDRALVDLSEEFFLKCSEIKNSFAN